jgi:diguanylate cyclase (GGDEF)-like protein
MEDIFANFGKPQFESALASLLQSATETKPLSLLVIDLDKFKAINDVHGHSAGDEVLRKTAAVLQFVCEGKGTPYRYGGDELTVLLANHSIQEAAAVAERVRQGIARLKFDSCPEEMTASIGVASFPSHTNQPDKLFDDADAAMYKSKDGGGNQVQIATSGGDMDLGSSRGFRLDIASRADAVGLWMKLERAYYGDFSVMITNDSDEDVTVEAITLKRDKLYLSRPAKRQETDDWKVGKFSKKMLSWHSSMNPVDRLRTMEPHHALGQILEIDIVVWGRVLGRLKTFTHTILVTADFRNSSFTEY